MSQHKHPKRRFPMAAVLAVILILAGVAAIAGSLWMQENEISTGAEVYEALVEQLKQPPTTEEKPETQQDELPADDTTTEETPVTQDEPDQEQPVQEQPDQPADQIYEPAVTVVPPLTVQPTEPEQQILQPMNLPESPKEAAPGFTGADLAACKAANSDFAAWLQIPDTDIDYPVVLTNDVDYYLDHTFTGEESIIGCLFSLGRTDYAAPSDNIAIYGHHMRRSRSTTMFQPLHNYKKASFRNEHATIHLDTTIRDDYTRFSIEKLDESENPLAGVEFSLVSSNGVAIMSARTDRNGIATFEKVPFGTYRIVEAKPLAGYLPAEMEVEVTIDGTFINPEHPIATIINVPNEIVIRKVDQDGKPLAGASFGLFDAFGERFSVATSDENGMVRFTKVPYGSYTIRELSAPDGYLASREEIAVTINADYRSSDKPIATVKNHFKRVQFIKVDTSGKYLPGVEFSLINAVTHEVVETATSNDKGEFIFTKFDYGDWIVRETAAPEGYNRMEDYLLHVDESWTEPKPITLVNIPDTYMFFKSDNRKNALAGATFAVEDENGNVVQEVVSAENGVVYIYGLTPGKYTIRETATVEGFTVNDDTIEVVIDEKYEVPTKLKRFVNYPSISTGVDVSPTALTWVGAGLVGIAGLIVVLSSVISNIKHPKRKRK